MAFNQQSWGRISGACNNDVVTLQDGTFIGAPNVFTYVSATDLVATIAASAYFNAVQPELNLGDLIYAVGTDGQDFLTVTSVTLPVTVSVNAVAGDVQGPASSVDNDIAVFNGLSGKIIKDGGVSIAGIQNGSIIYAASSAGTDTYAVTLSPVPTAYVNGMVVNFKADVANTGPATLNVNGLGAIALNKLHDQALTTGDIEAGQIVSVVYNSTGPKFQVQSQIALSVISGALNTVLQGQGAGVEPAYSTATYPATTTVNQILYSSATNTVTGLATANDGVLITSAAGVPSISSTLPSGITLVAPVLGTPASGNLANCTGYPASGLSGLGANVATWLATPTSANLAAAVATTSTGSGSLVFNTSPTFVTPVLGVATGTSFNTITGVASQSDQETATSIVVTVTPGVQQFHPSASKFWIQANAAGAIQASYNITSITDGGTGLITVTIATDFSSATYEISGICEKSDNVVRPGITAHAAGSFSARGNTNLDALTDPDFWFFSGFGDQ